MNGFTLMNLRWNTTWRNEPFKQLCTHETALHLPRVEPCIRHRIPQSANFCAISATRGTRQRAEGVLASKYLAGRLSVIMNEMASRKRRHALATTVAGLVCLPVAHLAVFTVT